MRASQNGHERIGQLLNGCMLDRLLLDLHLQSNGIKELQRVELEADGAQSRAW